MVNWTWAVGKTSAFWAELFEMGKKPVSGEMCVRLKVDRLAGILSEGSGESVF